MMSPELITTTNNAFKKDKYSIISRIETEFNSYLSTHNPNFFTHIRIKDFDFLFSLYDKYYFSGNLAKHLKITLDFSHRLTKSAGMVKFNLRTLSVKIIFSIPLIFGAYLKETQGYIVNGIFCKNPSEALMRVMEHELTHIAEFILHGNSKCSKPRFIKYSYQLFGHTENKHKIGHEIKLETESYVQKFKKGDNVNFVFKNTVYNGNITRISKRATVMVGPDRKFYVPLCLLYK